jgi:U3 small nucleolar RNA-associated protein 4
MSVNPASNLLALGCEDGTVRLLSLSDDTLTHHRRFDRVKCRVMSIAWGPPIPRHNSAVDLNDDSSDDEEDDWSDSWLVTGGSDSSLRKWDVATGRVLDRMGTDKIRGERTLVWSVGVLGFVHCSHPVQCLIRILEMEQSYLAIPLAWSSSGIPVLVPN